MACVACYQRSYGEGVAAIARIFARYGYSDWARTGPCAPWSSLDLLRHLHVTAQESVTGHLHALQFGPKELMTSAELAEFNAKSLTALSAVAPHVSLRNFQAAAWRFLRMATAEPDLPTYSFRGRTWSARCNVGVLAVEWHLHAWDLATTIGLTYHPRQPAVLAEAFRDGMAYLDPPATDGWPDLLRAAGRTLGVAHPV
ncbi:maleylpyruvate isomerase N-terminal domain-containing protein [Verrucosispora sp. WMMD573]|uniref:maleylpyruvate isomerase N-terminal domain-containing protein n=1 Tax=Verrucosispora sp. WMMD573 TaxID=3015149 RepID=UPI00248B8420|nr:maleylpyruvate isomerase N-terminal domain-containing protein [Verrucosispora sp. WMMD573]WBB56465.1 maleylpyruvate isomerase N-terminal domain-containing protein [Verrucosispora sp. WMMD573]